MKIRMGHFTNYEIEFGDYINWNDDLVKDRLKSFNVTYLYLRDLAIPSMILCAYSGTPIEEILVALNSVYSTSIRYRIYNTTEGWNSFKVV